MKFDIPESLTREHEGLHEQLHRATEAGGAVAAAARDLIEVMHPHFVREEEIAMPPLALLGPLSRGEYRAEMDPVLELTDALADELPQMLEEHQRIRAAVGRLPLGFDTPGRGLRAPPLLDLHVVGLLRERRQPAADLLCREPDRLGDVLGPEVPVPRGDAVAQVRDDACLLLGVLGHSSYRKAFAVLTVSRITPPRTGAAPR